MLLQNLRIIFKIINVTKVGLNTHFLILFIMTYLITILKSSSGGVKWIHRLENVSEDYFKGFYDGLLTREKEKN